MVLELTKLSSTPTAKLEKWAHPDKAPKKPPKGDIDWDVERAKTSPKIEAAARKAMLERLYEKAPFFRDVSIAKAKGKAGNAFKTQPPNQVSAERREEIISRLTNTQLRQNKIKMLQDKIYVKTPPKLEPLSKDPAAQYDPVTGRRILGKQETRAAVDRLYEPVRCRKFKSVSPDARVDRRSPSPR